MLVHRSGAWVLIGTVWWTRMRAATPVATRSKGVHTCAVAARSTERATGPRASVAEARCVRPRTGRYRPAVRSAIASPQARSCRVARRCASGQLTLVRLRGTRCCARAPVARGRARSQHVTPRPRSMRRHKTAHATRVRGRRGFAGPAARQQHVGAVVWISRSGPFWAAAAARPAPASHAA